MTNPGGSSLDLSLGRLSRVAARPVVVLRRWVSVVAQMSRWVGADSGALGSPSWVEVQAYGDDVAAHHAGRRYRAAAPARRPTGAAVNGDHFGRGRM